MQRDRDYLVAGYGLSRRVYVKIQRFSHHLWQLALVAVIEDSTPIILALK